MRKLLAIFALLLAGSGVVCADAGGSGVQSATSQMLVQTKSVFNDSGSALTSGTIVVWDNDDTEYDRSGYPYVTTTTTVDSPHTAGVTLDASCADQTMCEIVTRGWAWVRVADSSDAVSEDTLIGTSGTAGLAGDYGTGANTCALGTLLESYNKESGGDNNSNGQVFPVFVNINCN